MIFYFQNNVCNESKGIQNIGPQLNAVVYGLPVFAIPNHERNTNWPRTTYVQVGNGSPTSKPWSSISKIVYPMNLRGSKT